MSPVFRQVAAVCTALFIVLAGPCASAQLLPGNILDDPLRNVQRPVDDILNNRLPDVRDTADSVLHSARKAVPRALAALGGRRERLVENNWLAVDREWLALLTPEQAATLDNARLNIISRTPLASSGLVMVRVVVSNQDDNAARAQQLLRSLGATAADRNHIYVPQSRDEPQVNATAGPRAGSQARARIGLIDTALNRKHAALKKADILDKDFVAGGGRRPTAHGTSIASLLVGGEKGHEGLLPNARLVAASVFYSGSDDATGATTASLVSALDWIAEQNVGVVNMSLAGPPNEVLARMIDHLATRGVLVVAAVGNDGPSARPLYPAAYEPVVAVTAVDRKNTVYRWANQGPQVDLAAFGVGTNVARDRGGYEQESGTSFAAPVVTAAIAQLIADGAKTSSQALKALIAAAEDLGPGGRDDAYGYGLVRPEVIR